MKTPYCDQEQSVISALLSGPLPDHIQVHVGNCPVCSEVLLVTEYLREESALLENESSVPHASQIWRKAQARARENALAKATLPIRIMRTCAAALAILVSPWLVLEFSHAPAWMPTLDFKHFSLWDGNWLAALTGTTLLGITATFVCIGLSSWYMLREK
jgi:hypothetical protein